MISCSNKKHYFSKVAYVCDGNFAARGRALQGCSDLELTRDELICKYQFVIPSIIRKKHFDIQNLDRADLYQVGLVALANACDNFSSERVSTFGSYVYCCVQGALLDYINTSYCKLSLRHSGERELRRLRPHISEAHDLLEKGDMAGWNQLLTKLNVSHETAMAAVCAQYNAFSYDHDSENNDEENYGNEFERLSVHNDDVANDDVEGGFFMREDKKELRCNLSKALMSLKDEEREMITALYLDEEPITQAEYAEVLGVSRAAVNQKVKRILSKLADGTQGKDLKKAYRGF